MQILDSDNNCQRLMKNFGIFREFFMSRIWFGFGGRALKTGPRGSLAYETRQDMHEGADRTRGQMKDHLKVGGQGSLSQLFIYLLCGQH